MCKKYWGGIRLNMLNNSCANAMYVPSTHSYAYDIHQAIHIRNDKYFTLKSKVSLSTVVLNSKDWPKKMASEILTRPKSTLE